MAEFEPIVPGFGTMIDTGEEFEPIIPGMGTYIEQESDVGGRGLHKLGLSLTLN